MDEKQINLRMEVSGDEREYILPPHPKACVPVMEKPVCPDEPIAAKETLSDLVRQAVDEVRCELMAELETQATRIQVELQADLRSELQLELQSELRREPEGRLEGNDQIKKS
jgi:hypothetical protein